MGPTAVQVADLEKRYDDVQALQGVSFSVEPGEIFGLVGPNGAGKTTTLRTLSTLLNVDSGTVSVFGTDVQSDPNAVRKRIRYLPEDAGSYDNLTGRQYLEFVADFYSDRPEELVERGIEIADLDERIESKTSEYSKGMTRKLLLASTIMTEPDLAILDEPTSGLDVENARTIRKTVKEFPGQDRSVLLSSHNMLEVEYLCDRIGLLNDGQIVADGAPQDVIETYDAENLEEAFLEAVA
ncbi:ABC transporter ATP-binding protein [Halorhabdus sp. CUG00001]|uniref:ABC transporter ATP-binding protein n=1 Tax=Halorhabdus sp. CUG00001 TaxID=2600297 RepID=UPI00131DD06D|nr:ABC transporter ATP-binding protein [Halorhabdus sp. CUG00001]